MGGCEQPEVARINETGMHKWDEKSIDKMEKVMRKVMR